MYSQTKYSKLFWFHCA